VYQINAVSTQITGFKWISQGFSEGDNHGVVGGIRIFKRVDLFQIRGGYLNRQNTYTAKR
jgi:hypothetical protein